MSKNILLITADHMRHDAIACNADGAPSSALAHVIRTPNLDRLAREGVTFRNSFTPNPICVPAQVAITTSNRPIKCNVVDGWRLLWDQPEVTEVFARPSCNAVMSAANPLIHGEIKEVEQRWALRSSRLAHSPMSSCKARACRIRPGAARTPEGWRLTWGYSGQQRAALLEYKHVYLRTRPIGMPLLSGSCALKIVIE